MTAILWERYPRAALFTYAKTWLTLQANMQLAPNTIDAYGRGLEDFLLFCSRNRLDMVAATREHISLWVRDLGERPNPNREHILIRGSGVGLSNATKAQRLTAVRLFYDFLCEEGVRGNNPVGRAVHAPGRGRRDKNHQVFLRGYTLSPWIPTEAEWLRLLAQVKKESLRNRLMFTLQYECALRREELCLLRESYFDPAHRTLHIPGTITKSRRSRIVVYFGATASLYGAYIEYRRSQIGADCKQLFLSESPRNRGGAITASTWTKVIERLAEQARVTNYTTHTARHLRLTDLARAGWDLDQLAAFAGHSMTDTTLRYIHRSGRDLAACFARTMAGIHKWREKKLKELLDEKNKD
jgi:integrase/recombinase XerD